MRTNAQLVIEPVHHHRGYRECEALQKAVWGFDDVAVVPDHVLHTIVEGGGLLLAAYDGVGPGREMVGFVLSLVGWWEVGKRLRHQSLMAAVRPDWQGKGVGYLLKCAQRQHVLAQGIDLITWTFDPLESRNAHFNLNKLGAVVTRYMPNYYGEFRDVRNRGLPTDRFLCEWRLRSPRTEAHLGGRTEPRLSLGRAEAINRTRRLPSGLRAPAGFRPGLSAPQLLFEIPKDLQALRRADLELARAWRLESRQALSLYFSEGWWVVGLFHQGERSFLVLERASQEVFSRP
ncbi:GNAT family N-acetyltransferase [Candidatus Bipolaricaulota bacterium]|nr:GNAT family N-acetyltransferase [Candidatus Bipolaricaulota bacterium]